MLNNNWTRQLEKKTPAEQVAEVMTRVYEQRLTTPSGGNISMRDKNGDIWMTPSQIDKGCLSAEDIICIHKDGRIVGKHKPTSEYPFHLKIYKTRADVRAIVHAHPIHLVSYSCSGQVPDIQALPEIHNIIGSGIHSKYAIPGSNTLADNIGEAFQQNISWALMENHGGVCVDESLSSAFYKMELLEHAASILLKTEQIGNIQRATLSDASDPISDAQEPIRDLSKCNELLYFMRRAAQRGLFPSTGNSWSIRSGNQILTNNHMADFRNPSQEDIKAIPLKENAHPHAAIYLNNQGINSILSASPENIMAFAASDVHLDTRTIPESYIVLRSIPERPYHCGSQGLAELFKPENKTNAVLIKNKNILMSGTSVFQVFDQLEVADFTAASIIKAKALGGIRCMSKENIEEITDTYLK